MDNLVIVCKNYAIFIKFSSGIYRKLFWDRRHGFTIAKYFENSTAAELIEQKNGFVSIESNKSRRKKSGDDGNEKA